MFECFPNVIKNELVKLKNITEIRLRVNSNLKVYLGERVLTFSKIKISKEILNDIVLTACKRSIYGYDEFIKRGFITTDYGERIGICGEFVYNNGEICTIKNYSSLCVRIPNDVKGVSNEFFNKYIDGSVLVVSKSGVGKTTFLRDLTRNISLNRNENVVVIDERNEIAVKNGEDSFYLGDTVDVLTFANKTYGFTHAVRTLNPSCLVTDELITVNDFNSVVNAVKSGVKVFASIHGDNNFKNKIETFIKNETFNYFVYISKTKSGREYKIYDKNLNII